MPAAESYCPHSFKCPITYSVMRDPVIVRMAIAMSERLSRSGCLSTTPARPPTPNCQIQRLRPTTRCATPSRSGPRAFKVVPKVALDDGRTLADYMVYREGMLHLLERRA